MRPSYIKVFLTFARNSLVRDMSFRLNFILQCISSISWAVMNWGLFKIIYNFTPEIGRGTGWQENEFFIFLGTVWIICLLYTSPSPRDATLSRMPSSA